MPEEVWALKTVETVSIFSDGILNIFCRLEIIKFLLLILMKWTRFQSFALKMKAVLEWKGIKTESENKQRTAQVLQSLAFFESLAIKSQKRANLHAFSSIRLFNCLSLCSSWRSFFVVLMCDALFWSFSGAFLCQHRTCFLLPFKQKSTFIMFSSNKPFDEQHFLEIINILWVCNDRQSS